MAKTSAAESMTSDVADPYAWDPNPVVLVSRRRRVFNFPVDLVHRPHTEADLARWRSPESTPATRQEQTIAVWMGVTFLGEWTSSWHYLRSAPQGAPRRDAPPPEDARILCWPSAPATTHPMMLLTSVRANMDTSTSPARLLPPKVREFSRRVVDYLRVPHLDGTDLWDAQDGYDAPELQLLPLEDLLTHRTEAGNHAYTTVLNSIRHYRRDARECVTPLGALHDYAVRYPSARAIVDECRKKAAAWKLG